MIPIEYLRALTVSALFKTVSRCSRLLSAIRLEDDRYLGLWRSAPIGGVGGRDRIVSLLISVACLGGAMSIRGMDWAPGRYWGGFGGLEVHGVFELESADVGGLVGEFTGHPSVRIPNGYQPVAVTIHPATENTVLLRWESVPGLPSGEAMLRRFETPYGPAYLAVVPYEEDGAVWGAWPGLWLDSTLERNPFDRPESILPSIESRADGRFRWWGAEPDGLANDATRAMIQTSDGFLWVGTVDGLSRFDGREWRTYSADTAPELPGYNFRSLLEDRHGNLVALLKHHGLFRLRGDQWEGFVCNAELEGLVGNGLFEDAAGALWFAADSDRLARVDLDENLTFWPADDIMPLRWPEESIPPLLGGGTGFGRGILFTSSGGLRAFDPDSTRGAYWIPPIARDGVRVTAGLHDDFWISSLSAVFHYNSSGRALESYSPSEYTDSLRHAIPRRVGGLWILGGAGLFAMPNPSRLIQYSKVPAAATEGVTQALEDREGNLWIATNGRGVCQFVPNPFTEVGDSNLSKAMRGQRARPISMALSQEGGLRLAASSFVARRETEGAWRIAHSHDDFQVSAVAVESDEAYWIGVSPYEDQRDVWERGGPPREGFPVAVRVSERGSELHYIQGKPEGLSDVTTMAWVPGSGAWVGSPEGVWICQDGQALSWNALHGLPAFAVTAIVPTEAGIWIGTENHGIFHALTETSSVVRYTKDDGSAPVSGVSSVAQSARSEGLWLAGVGGAHWWPINGGARGARDLTGNIGRPVHALIEDSEGNLWAGSSLGIHCLPATAVEEAWGESSLEPEWILFGRRDGLEKASVETGHFPAAAQTEDGRIYFCIQGTFVGFEPEALLRRSAFAPSARIVAVGDEERAWRLAAPFSDGALSEALPPDAGDHLQVTFGATHFTQPELLSFRYRLPGRSKAWTELGAQESVWLLDLGPGRHRLEVQVTDHRQRRSSIASVDFRIAPRWSERVVVRGGVGLGVLALFWNWQRQRARQNLARERLNSRLREAADRRRIARDMHDEIGANFAQLKILGELLQNDRVRGEAARDTLAKMVRLAREGSQTLREILWSIGQNSDRDGRDLGEFIRITMEKLLEGTETRLEFQYLWRDPGPIGPLFKREALMITKGVVSNVIRHAHASRLQCIVTGDGNRIRMSWIDNGIGFDPEAIPEDSLGLATLRERASQWGGSVRINSQPDQGTRVEILLSLDQSNESEANTKDLV